MNRDEVAHELRTPLTTIKGVLRLIADGRLAAVAPEAARDLVDRAARQLEKLETVVQRIEADYASEVEEHAIVLYLEEGGRAEWIGRPELIVGSP